MNAVMKPKAMRVPERNYLTQCGVKVLHNKIYRGSDGSFVGDEITMSTGLRSLVNNRPNVVAAR